MMAERQIATDELSHRYESLASLLEDGREEEAEKQLLDALKDHPADAELLNTLGTIYAKRGDLARAEEKFSEAISADPQHGDAHYNLGLIHSRQSRRSEAVEDFLQAVNINPSDWEAHNNLGAIYYSQGKALLAKGHFRKALDSNPLHKEALLNLFELCWYEGAYSEALERVEKFLKAASPADGKRPEPEPHAANRLQAPSPQESAQEKLHIKHDSRKSALVIKKRSSSKAEETFLKHVPEELHRRKSGLNIAVVGDFNIAGQLSLLFRMVNRYTIHKARLIILQKDYLSYDEDIILSDADENAYAEARAIIEQADFFHIGRFPKNFADIDWSKRLRPDNALIQYFGSEIRANAREIYRWHVSNGILGLSAWDYTMLENAPFFYHINLMCDLDRIEPCEPPGETIRICHPSTNRQVKKTDLFLSVADKLKQRYPLEVELIEGVSNEECLAIKKRCQITYDQISVGIYGLSAVESMAAGHAVLTGISNFAASYHPDSPIIYVHERNLYQKIEDLLVHRDKIARIGEAGRKWASRHHNPLSITRQFLWLYDFIVNGHRLVEDPDSLMLR